jgi:hypothetical protein
LGWDGEGRTFGLLQLYHRRDADTTYREPWINQGPTFSKSGRPGFRDWDFWSRRPFYIIDIAPRDVQSGKVIGLVKRWARPIAARYHESFIEKERNTLNSIESIGYEVGNRIYREGARSGAGAPILAKKFHEQTANMARHLEHDDDAFIESRLPQAPPGGWEKHKEADQGDAADLGEISCDSKN